MARFAVLLLVLLAVAAAAAHPAFARKPSSRRLDDESSPYTSSPFSGSSPSSSTPSSTPDVTIPPVGSSPSSDSPVTIPPVTSSPTGGYGGYGSRSGMGTSGFWGRKAGGGGRLPRVLSLVSSLAKIFGPRLIKFLGSKITLGGALKNKSSEPMSSLAREGSASLLNAYTYNGFPLSTGDVITQFNDALESPELAAQQALKFQQLNEAV